MREAALTSILTVLFLTVSAQEPCPRNQPVMVYHQKLTSVFMFGGFCSESKKRLNDFWRFTDGKWQQVEIIIKPAARSGHAMVYDERNDQIILFGGKNDQGSLLNDTWGWNGDEWRLIAKSGPEPRQSHRMVYTDQGILLFGGSNEDELSLADTWLLTKNSWEEIGVTKGPPPRRQHTLSYDRKRRQTILFGGFDRKEDQKIIYGDTWAFNGITWSRIATNPELARDHHAMAFNPLSESVILFGGYNTDYLGDTWSWKGNGWEKLHDEGPARAGKPGLIYDQNLKTMVLFGGGNNDNMYLMDFWLFDHDSQSWKGM